LKDLYKSSEINIEKIVKEKAIAKPLARLFKSEFANIERCGST
jgi:hypothetical protein